MDNLKYILNAFSIVFLIYVFGAILQITKSIYEKMVHNERFSIEPIMFWKEYNKKSNRNIFIGIILPIIIFSGGVNYVMAEFFAKEEIGAFYEKPEYIVDYSANIDLNGHSVFCIATIERLSGDYWIERIELPYNHVAYTGEEYYPYDDSPSILIGEEEWYCDITLEGVANDAAYERLQTEDLPSDGKFCASKESNIYHLPNCQYAKNIKKNNLIHFQNECEADVFGYTMCSVCGNRY